MMPAVSQNRRFMPYPFRSVVCPANRKRYAITPSLFGSQTQQLAAAFEGLCHLHIASQTPGVRAADAPDRGVTIDVNPDRWEAYSGSQVGDARVVADKQPAALEPAGQLWQRQVLPDRERSTGAEWLVGRALDDGQLAAEFLSQLGEALGRPAFGWAA